MAAMPAQSELRAWAAVIEDALARTGRAWRGSVLPHTGPLPLDNITQTAATGLSCRLESHVFEHIRKADVDNGSDKIGWFLHRVSNGEERSATYRRSDCGIVLCVSCPIERDAIDSSRRGTRT